MYCEKCGRKATKKDSFCINCGEDLQKENLDTTTKDKSSEKIHVETKVEATPVEYYYTDDSTENIKKTLGKGEKILSQYTSSDLTEWYATNKRIIKYKKIWNEEKIDELPYKHITSVSLTTVKEDYNKSIFAVGVILTLIGFFIGAIFYLISSRSLLNPLTILLVIFGVLLIIIAFLLKSTQTFYQFTGSEINKLEWQVQGEQNEDARKFIDEVRRKIT